MNKRLHTGAVFLAIALGVVAAPAGAQGPGACSVNGACTMSYSIPCSQAITSARLGGGNGQYLGDGTVCDVSCDLKAYGANQAVAFNFTTTTLDKVTGTSRVTVWQATSADWSLKNAAGGVVGSGKTSTPLSFPIVDGDTRVGYRLVQPPSALITPASAAFVPGFYGLTAVGRDGYGRTFKAGNLVPPVSLPGFAPPPSGLAAAVATDVNLSWTPPDRTRYAVAGTNLKAATTSAGPFSTILGTGVTTNTLAVPVSKLAGAYTWYVVASTVNATGEGPATAPVTVNLPLPKAPAAPTNVAAKAASGDVSVTWTASANATSYDVFYSKTSGSGWVKAGTTAGTFYSIPGLAPATTYFFVVNATGPGGASPLSAQATLTTSKILY